jgi:IS5 family transposase
MRLKLQEQLPFVFQSVEHRRAHELRRMDRFLEVLETEVLRDVHHDLVGHLDRPDVGRLGLSADSTLRALLYQRMAQLSYRELEFTLCDSVSARQFCRIEGVGPSRSALQRAIKRVQPATLERINAMLVGRCVESGFEDGSTIAIDATVMEADIAAPTDSKLLCDVICTGARLLSRAALEVEIRFVNHSRLARRRQLAAHHARRKAARVPHYRELIWAARRTVKWLREAADKLAADSSKLGAQLRELSRVGHQVISQADRRVLRKESVPADHKVVSLHAPHVDIIIKDNRNTYFGHKLFAAKSKTSGLIVDMLMMRGNPADSQVAVSSVVRAAKVLDTVPHSVAMDGGFASKRNLSTLKTLGITNVCFSKRRGIEVEEMVENSRIYRALRNFRSTIEATFSWLKGSFGLGRCNWRSFESYQAYAWATVISHNLTVLARAGPV